MQDEVDEPQGTELELFYENDRRIYDNSQAWATNYRKKMKKGNYDHELAVRGIAENFIPRVIAAYNKEYGQIGKVSKATKYWMAERWVAHFEVEESLQ